MRAATVILVIGLLPAVIAAQSPLRDRPELPAGADVNDPLEYLRLAERLVEASPEKAEPAYAWALRLAPGWAEATYGLWVARLTARRDVLIRWSEADRRTMRRKELLALDSLRLAFHTADPFLFGRYDHMVLMAYFNELIDRDLRRTPGGRDVDRAALDYELRLYLERLSPELSGWLAYTQRQFASAIGFYTSALKGSKDRAALYAMLGLAQYQAGQNAAAIASLKRAVEERAKQDQDKLVHLYESQATYEFMVGRALEARGDTAGAREAYARALLSELSYYPAHVRLARLDLLAGDTAAALNGLQTAVDIRPGDAGLRAMYGGVLLAAGKTAEAVSELKQAIELEPYFAAPYYSLGRAAEGMGNRAAATAWYRQFLERASRRDAARPAAESRLRELGS